MDEASRVETAEREAAWRHRQARSELAASQAAEREAARAGRPAPCVDCEELIPEPRRQAVPGCLRCAHCERMKAGRKAR
ncbi:hypothetical protein B0920_02135 [Massilia sp. KIM]|nr:hypothetical protein B0920_02135 [Massilia sp. KIM]